MPQLNLYDDFQQLFREHYVSLCRYAYKFLNDRQQSEDVVQECFIRFWEIKKEYSGESYAHYYLIKSVKNRCITLLRKKITTVPIEQLDDFDDLEAVAPPRPEDSYSVEELIRNALELLPPRCRLIFKMSRIEKTSYKEIAEQLKISIKTVENQMGKAIYILRKFAIENKIPYKLVVFYISCHINGGIPSTIV